MEGQQSRSAGVPEPRPPRAAGAPELVRRLVAQLRAAARERGTASTPPRVLLDVRADGARCVVFSADPPRDEVSLTPRERQIVELVALGHPNKSVAAELHISPWTVGTHLRRAFAKLGVSSRAELVAQAIQRGLIAMVVPPRRPGGEPAGRA